MIPMCANRSTGYALFVVLMLMIVLMILAAGFLTHLESGARQTRALAAEAEALNAADSGLQYALEGARQGKMPADRAEAAGWNVLQGAGGVNICFKVFAETGCPSNQLCVESYGKVARGRCDQAGELDQILSARRLRGVIDMTQRQESLVSWEEIESTGDGR